MEDQPTRTHEYAAAPGFRAFKTLNLCKSDAGKRAKRPFNNVTERCS